MANFNTLIKRKQYIWLGLILAGGAAAVGGGLYLSDLNMSSDEEAPAQGEPAPDMTGWSTAASTVRWSSTRQQKCRRRLLISTSVLTPCRGSGSTE